MVEIRGGAATSLDDMVFEFLEYGEESSPESSFSSGDGCYDDDRDEERSFDVEESKAFWGEQMKLLQVCNGASETPMKLKIFYFYFLCDFLMEILFCFHRERCTEPIRSNRRFDKPRRRF